jgi:hypothetical protein
MEKMLIESHNVLFLVIPDELEGTIGNFFNCKDSGRSSDEILGVQKFKGYWALARRAK